MSFFSELPRDIKALLLTTFLYFSSFNLLLPTFPVFIDSLGGSERIVGLLGGLFALAAVVQRPFLATLTDTRGRRSVLWIAALTTATGPLLYLLSEHFAVLAAARFYHAISLAAFVVASQTLMADLAPASQRGTLIGLYVVTSGFPAAIFPPLGFVIIEALGYDWLFIAAALIGLLMFPVVMAIREPAAAEETASVKVMQSLRSLARNRNVLVACAGILSITIVLGALNTFLPLYGRSLGIANIGIYFTVFALMFMIGSTFSGRLSDAYGRKKVVLPAFLLVALGIAILVAAQGYALLGLSAVVVGIGFSTLQTLLLVFTVDSTELSHRSQAISVFNNFFDLGFSAGGILLGVVAAFSFSALWLVLAVFALLGFTASAVFLKEVKPGASAAPPG